MSDLPQELHKEDIASLSIRRPILVLVLNLLIAIAGIAAIMAVEVRELPDVDRPIVSVRGFYPGASPETMDAEVTSIVEGAVARVSGIRNIRSSSEENNMRLHVEFSPTVDLNTAASDVREAVSRVERDLPPDIESLTVVKADPNANPIINLALVSETLDELQMTRRAEKDLIPELVSIDGVADVVVYGQRQKVLRVVMDPIRLASFGLSVTDVANSLRQAPFDVPSGSFRSGDLELLVRADASAVTERAISDIIVRNNTRLADVAQVFFAPEDASSYVRLNGLPVVGLGVVRQSQSNTLDIAAKVHAAVERINTRFSDFELLVTEDSSKFIKGSMREVLISMSLTVTIVILTIWLFIGSLRVTLIPSVAIPVALIGTIATIWAMGFSLNILTLLALVLATGLVVDDAIVVLENIQRRRHQGLGARAAAVLGTRQVFFAVIATTAVLISVFVPVAMLPSTAGRLFREFGFVLAFAVAISSFVALSLVPAMAARIVPEKNGKSHPVRNRLQALGDRLAGFYSRSLTRALELRWLVVAFALAAIGGAVLAYNQVPQELLPQEDRGVIYVNATGPDGTGLEYTERQVNAMEQRVQPLLDSGEATQLFSVVGQWDPNRGRVILPLADWDKRERSQQEMMAQIEGPMREIPGAFVRVSGSNSLGLWNGGGGVDIALVGSDYYEIFAAAEVFARAIEDQLPQLSDPDINFQPTQPQLAVTIDRRRASELGIPLENISTTLRAMVDGYDLVDLSVADEAIPIILESSGDQIDDPGDLVNLFVSTRDGRLLPLSSVVTITEEAVAAELDRHKQRRAIEIDINLEDGYPLASAVADLRRLAETELPAGIGLIFLGEAETLDETSKEVAMTYIIALIVVFLVLCAQFESFTSAAIVMLTVPFGVASAIFALLLTGISINVYSQIGLVMLIGLMAKNGILLVEFADQLRDRGYSVLDAVQHAAKVRLRPIFMTMMSTVFGALPLILSTGPGAEARNSIGWVIFGGLGLAAVFTLYLTPVVYALVARWTKPRAEQGDRLVTELEQAQGIPDRHES
ncbi:efflux RND transporter permease subunit [Gilvimarinus sp. SDUM040013]|uniref:Efflux RND transporter permease subunit n=1 Tax=Gilvimarinus gilvus TaxID=3058038 RepID=A0ABU4RVP9_9GAMM|nr:efflux RND transporter permease subunit [Gilvimarinus sp. SDUM040013]MDO3388198.1 efflux RND transporter permease subunit [Gilvimarinus sp. SDUM040013]MDX6847748.1 efflux RND transporter permease subunit [Gilvimarinus sp. SDUM040013]